MLYNRFKDLDLSALGMGCMRLPVLDGDDARIDQAALEEMVACAMAAGINYYDTAWGYHGGNSEIAVSRALRAYPREKYFLASKFPGYDLGNMPHVREIFARQREKCEVDYFDFYLFHNVCEMNIDAYLNPANGIFEHLVEQKRQGRIRHLGFSAHGSIPVIQRFLDAYGAQMEFCQIQLNWLDWEFQKAREKVEFLRAQGIPVWVMEPMRGGRLADLPARERAALEALRPGDSPAKWAMRFLQGIDGVTMILTGASSLEQLRQNIAVFQTPEPLDGRERAALLSLADEMVKKIALPCTACRYCAAHCPRGLDIPRLLELYNEHAFTGGGFLAPMALKAMPEDKQPSACVGCRSCEAVCPQQIKISEAMADFAARLRA